MGRAQQNKSNELNDRTRVQSQGRYTDYTGDQNAIAKEYRDQGRPAYTGAMGVYDNLAQGFAGRGAGGGGGTGGGGSRVSASGYATQQPMYKMKDFNPANIADAKSGYDEFAKTGGYSDQDSSIFRARGNSVIPSFYSNLKQNMDTRRNVQGGYGTGFDAADASMARQMSQAAYQGQLETEGTLQNAIRAGRQFGIGGQADLGKYQSDWELQQDTTQGQFSEDYANRQDRAGMFSAGESNSASQANAGLDERAREFDAEQDFARRQEAGRGYSGIYADSGQLEAGANDRWLRGLGQWGDEEGASIDRQYRYNRPWGGSLANSLIGGGSSALGGWLSGIGKAGVGAGGGVGGDETGTQSQYDKFFGFEGYPGRGAGGNKREPRT